MKQCQNCKKDFTIESEDFDFYKKIGVPPPTWCPECRKQRRLLFRNERILKKNKCFQCGREIISLYDRESSFNVYCQECWWGDLWDGTQFGKEYDFSRPFFTQFHELFQEVPRIALNGHRSNKDSEYVNYIIEAKDSYLCFGGGYIENVLFSTLGVRTKDSAEIYFSFDCTFCYEISDCFNCYRLIFGRGCVDCRDSYFLDDCKNCNDCILCSGLRNKSYCYKNRQLSKSEFVAIKEEFGNLTQNKISSYKKEFVSIALQTPKRFLDISHSQSCVGDHITNSKNCVFSFNIIEGENCKYSSDIMFKAKDIYDGTSCGIGNEQIYEAMTSSININQGKFSSVVRNNCFDIQYVMDLHSSSHLFGCIGLKNKQYCILNKQYTKEEYEELVPKIIKHMNDMPYIDQKGRVYTYGEFFPLELSPFAYNETIAQEYFPLTKEQALTQGFGWKDSDTKNYSITKKPEDLPDSIKEVNDSILNEVIGCVHGGTCVHQCTTAFRIIPQELEFYRRMNLPLPVLCPNCRHYERLAQRNPLKLWKRQCMCNESRIEDQKQKAHQNTVVHQHGEGRCPNIFETSYAPERKETVYCESCYQNEIV